MVRLIAADMDGTLLDENSLLPEETFELIEKLRDRGVIFCASSGRRYETLRWMFEPVADRMDYVGSLARRSMPTACFSTASLLDARGAEALPHVPGVRLLPPGAL